MNTAAADIALKINGEHALTLRPGMRLRLPAKVGERYQLVRKQDQRELPADGVLASRQGDDLLLSYADGSELTLQAFFPTCQGQSCGVELPRNQATPLFLSADSASATVGSQSQTVLYAYGSQDQTAELLQSRGIETLGLRGLQTAGGMLSYVPPTDLGWAMLAPLGLLAAPSGGGAPAPVPLPTVIEGGVVAGPVIAGHGLRAVAYRSDGTVLASGEVGSDGRFTLRVGNAYKGAVLVRVYDLDIEHPDYFDEASGEPKDLGADLRAMTVIPAPGTYQVSVNVLTELAVRSLGLAGGDAGSSGTAFAGVSDSQIAQANQKVAASVGLTQDLVLGAAPVAIITEVGASNDQANDYGRLLAALSGAEQGSSTEAVLVELTQKLQVNATGQVLERLLEGAKVVDLVAAISDITNQKSSVVTIDVVSQDNRLSPVEMIAGVQVQGTAAAVSSLILTWSDASVAAQATASRNLVTDAQGRWSAHFTAAELPALGATTLMAIGGGAVATRSVYLDEPPAPTIALAQTTGPAELTRNGRVDVAGVIPGASWDYSTDGGISWSAGSGTFFTATADGSKQALARQSIGKLSSAPSNRVSFTLDATAPTKLSLALQADSGLSGVDGISNDGAVTVSGLESGASWQFSTDGGNTWQSGTGVSFTLPPGVFSAAAVQARQSDAAGNVSALVSNAAALTIDATAPTASISSNASQLGLGATAQLTFALSESVQDFGLNSILVAGGSLSNFSGSGTSYSATFTPDRSLDGASTVQVAPGTLVDEAGNRNASGSSIFSLMTDTVSPFVSLMTSSRTQLRAGETAELTIVLSETSKDFGLDDLLATGGTLGNFSGSGAQYTVTFTPEADRTQPGSIGVGRGSFRDGAGNLSRSGDSDGLVLDINTQRPAAVLQPKSTALGVGEVTGIDIRLSQASTDFSLSDLSASRGSLSDFRALGDGVHYTVVFTPDAGFVGAGSVTLADGSFTNAAGNANGGGQGPAGTGDLAIDTVVPSVTITSASSALAIGKSARISFVFNKDPADSFDASDIRVSGGSLSNLVRHDALNWTARLTPADGFSGQAGIEIPAGLYTDAAGNRGVAGSAAAIAIDTKGPLADVLPLSGSTVLPGKSLALIFDEAVQKASGRIALVNDTDGTRSTWLVGHEALALSPDGRTLTITPSTPLVAGKKYHVEADPGSFTDLAGNAWAGIASTGTGDGTGGAPDAWTASAWRFTAATPSVSLSKIGQDGLVNGTENTTGVVLSGTIESNTPGMVAAFVAGDIAVSLTPRAGGTTVHAHASSYNPDTGAWSLTLPSNALVGGDHDILVQVSGTAGAASGATATTASSARADLSAAAPSLALLSDTGSNSGDSITSDATVTLSGLEDGASWEFSTNGGATWQAGSGEQFKAALADGLVTVQVRQTDLAGNVSAPASLGLTLDTVAERPVIHTVAGDGILNASETAAVITGTAEAAATLRLTMGSGKAARTVEVIADGTGHWSHALGSADLAALGSGQTQLRALQTDAAGNRSFASRAHLSVDTDRPTLTITSDKDLVSKDQTATIFFTLSEISKDFSASDIAVTGGTIGGLAGSGAAYTAVFTPTAASGTPASISVAGSAFSDLAGNAAEAGAALVLAVDTVAPTVAVSALSSSLQLGELATVSFVLSEASDSFGMASVTTVGGKLASLSANAAGTVYTGVFKPDPGFSGLASVSVASGALRDRGNNANDDGKDSDNSVSFAVQSQRTSLVLSADKTELKAAESTTLRFAFSSPPSGFALGDVVVSGGTLSDFAGSGSTYTATFTPTANVASGSAKIAVLESSYTGQDGNLGQASSLDTISFDTLAPTLLKTNPADNGYLPAAPGASLVATFSEPVRAGTGRLQLMDSSNAVVESFALDAVAIDGDTLTLTPSAELTPGATYHLRMDSGALLDGAGNAYAGIANASAWNFTAAELALSLDEPAGDGWVSGAEKSAAMAANGLVVSGKVSSTSPMVLQALQASDIRVQVALPTPIDNDGGGNKELNFSASSYDPSTGVWTAELPKTWQYTNYTLFLGIRVGSSTQTRDSLVDGHTDSLAVSVTGRNGTAAQGLTATQSDTFKVDLSAPAMPTLALASDTGASNSDGISAKGLVQVGNLEAGASWQFSVDGGATWQTGTGSSFILTQAGAATTKVKQMDAAGNASGERSLDLTLDNQAEAPAVDAIATDNRINATETGAVLSGSAEADATVSLVIGSNTRSIVANGSGVWTYTLQAADLSAMGQGSEVIRAQQTDKAGNVSGQTNVAIDVDTVRPTVTLANIGSASLLADQSTTLTATLSEPIADFSASSLTVSGGVLGHFTADATGLVYTGSFTPNDNSTSAGSIQVAAGALKDAAGNTNSAASNALSLSIQTVRPTVAVSSNIAAGATLFAGDTASLSFTLSQASSDFSAGDISVQGGALSNFTGSGSSYSATFTPDADSRAPGRVSVASGMFSNAAGNANADGADANNALDFVIATARPSVAIASDVGTLGGAQSATITFSFSEDPGESFTRSDVTVSGGTLGAITGVGLSYKASFTPSAGFAGAASITVASGSYSNGSGSLGLAGDSPSLTIDAVAPAVAIRRNGSAALGADQTDTITFDFTEAPGDSLTQADIDVSGGELGPLAAVSATRYVATFTPKASAVGTATIGLASGRFSDAAGNLNNDGADVNNRVSIAFDTGGAPGNVSAASAPSLSLAVDTGASASDGITSKGLIQVGDLANGASWEYSLDGGSNWQAGSGSSFTLPTAGIYSGLQARQSLGGSTSNAGSLSAAVDYRPVYGSTVSVALDVDTGISKTDNITYRGAPFVHGLGAGDTWRFSLDNGLKWYPGGYTFNGQYFNAIGLYQIGINTLGQDQSFDALVEATDLAGNTSTVKYWFRMDNQANSPNVTLAPEGGGAIVPPTNVSAGDVLKYELATFVNGAPSRTSLGSTYVAPTAPGDYTLFTSVIDAAGNYGMATTLRFTIAPKRLSFGADLNTVASGLRGWVIEGQSAGDASGVSVAGAGDVNGDGFGDLIIGANKADPDPSRSNAGRSYVVFGRNLGSSVSLSAVAAGSGGFVINGQCASDESGISVAGVGDFNGDGLSDLIIGASQSSTPTANGAGRSFVVFGKTSGAAVELSAVAAGAGGFVINGASPIDRSGVSVSGAGDVNGDGLTDLIVGANRGDSPARDAGLSYVVFGRTGATAIELSAVALGSGGFVINGHCANDYSGRGVSSAGDVNGDGLIDLIVGAEEADGTGAISAGRSYVVFGRASTSPVELSAVTAGAGGFAINGHSGFDYSGLGVSSAGDVNGDGLADLIIGARGGDPSGGANAGRSYVVFGKATGTAVELSAVAAGVGGFVINGQSKDDASGISVSVAGDLNGDGLSDLLIGATGPNQKAGISYVVFGKTSTAAVELSALAASSSGFAITGQYVGDASGSSVSGAGDVNGDGLDDLIVGAPGGDPASVADAGVSYVIFGSTSGLAGTGTRVDWMGNAANNVQSDGGVSKTLVGAGGGDTLTATAASVLYGGVGDDALSISQATATALQSPMGQAGNVTRLSRIDGGGGIDTLVLAENTALDLTKVAASSGNGLGVADRVASIERIDLSATGSSLTLSPADIAQIAGMNLFTSGQGWDLPGPAVGVARHQLVVTGAAGTLTLSGNWSYVGLATDPRKDHYRVYDGERNTQLLLGGGRVLPGTPTALQDIAIGMGGFVINGQSAGDNAGGSVSGAGDVNGDGLEDLIVGARGASSGAGRSFIVWGTAETEAIDLSAVAAGSGGFVILGQCATDQSGISVSGAGDVNGDGLADLIVGAHQADPSTGADAGRSFVVFGKTSGAAVALSDVTTGSGGFVINGQGKDDGSGRGVSSAGDVNGDGLVDLIIGAPLSDLPNAIADAGRSYLVYGKASTTAVELSAVASGSGGFVINGQCKSDQSGRSVASAGDVNGDGLADLIIGAPLSDPANASADAGRSYVVFGRTAAAAVNLSAVAAGTGGFVINGQGASELSGASVAGAGDVNGDGLADLIIGAAAANGAAGRTYVVFGKTAGAAINLSAVAAGSGGFVINGVCASDASGSSVASAGDFNGDGLSDLIIGAPGASGSAGRSYLVFGRTEMTPIGLAQVAAGSGGFLIVGQCANDASGTSVSSAGDVNGDGLADLIVGAPNHDPAAGTDAGRSYIIFGSTSGAPGLSSRVDWLGGDGYDTQSDQGVSKTLAGGAGPDVLTATAASVLYGGSGYDLLTINQTMATALQSNRGAGGNSTRLSRIDGGSDIDTLVLAAGTALDLTKVAGSAADDPEGNDRLTSIERVDLSAAGSSLTLSPTDIAQMAGMNLYNHDTGWTGTGSAQRVSRHQLMVNGTAGQLTVSGQWTYGGTVQDPATSGRYNVFNGERNTQLLLGDGRWLTGVPTTAAVELSAIAQGIGGFAINGLAPTVRSGTSVSGAGDVNGDGLSDLIVGEPLSFTTITESTGPLSFSTYTERQGRSYVVFGKTSGAEVNLVRTFQSGGFVIEGESHLVVTGQSVSSAGDFNGDGLADLIVGAPIANSATGRAYIVFGKSSSGTVPLLELTTNPPMGVLIRGERSGDNIGNQVASAGDVNGDGLADVVMSSYTHDLNGVIVDAGRGYVVFGRNVDGAPGLATVSLSAVAAGTGGFVINGRCANDMTGLSISGAGDVNGDGLSDLIVGVPNAGDQDGRSYVVFGKTSTTAVDLGDIAAGSGGGFLIEARHRYEVNGWSVSSAGDVNGDGLGDLFVGAPNSQKGLGAGYVVFGKTGSAAINLSSIATGSGGFMIQGESDNPNTGWRVASAGDVNGDGLADLLMSSLNSNTGRGITYVVFGKTGTAPIDLLDVSWGWGGYVIRPEGPQAANTIREVAGAGDVNGDGLADLILSALAINADTGKSYVVFGGYGVAPGLIRQGSANNDNLSDNGVGLLLVGGAGNDTLTATAASVLRGGSGSDTFIVDQTMVRALQTPFGQPGNDGALNASIEGGRGGIYTVGSAAGYSVDRVRLSGSNINFDLTQINNVGRADPDLNSRVSGIEVIELAAANNSLKVTAKDVLDLSDAVDLTAVTGRADYRQLLVTGPAKATIDLADSATGTTGWTKLAGTFSAPNWGVAGSFDAWVHDTSKAMLLAQTGVLVA